MNVLIGAKRPGRGADHSPPSSAEDKNACSCTSTPTYPFIACRGHIWCTRVICRLRTAIVACCKTDLIAQHKPGTTAINHVTPPARYPVSDSGYELGYFDVITSFLSGCIVGVGRVRTVTRAPLRVTSLVGRYYI